MKSEKMFDKNYYANRRNKLGQKQQQNLQKLNNAAYEYVNTQSDLAEQVQELTQREAESKKVEGTHAAMAETEKSIEDDKKKAKKA